MTPVKYKQKARLYGVAVLRRGKYNLHMSNRKSRYREIRNAFWRLPRSLIANNCIPISVSSRNIDPEIHHSAALPLCVGRVILLSPGLRSAPAASCLSVCYFRRPFSLFLACFGGFVRCVGLVFARLC